VSTDTRSIVEALYHCGKNGDLDGVFALLDENVVVHEPSFLPYGGSYKGRDSFLKLFSLIQEKYFDDSKLTIDYIAIDGPHAVVMARAPGWHGEEVVLAEEVLVRDGKIIEIKIYMHQAPKIT
jgi:uncharacterized protein